MSEKEPVNEEQSHATVPATATFPSRAQLAARDPTGHRLSCHASFNNPIRHSVLGTRKFSELEALHAKKVLSML